MDEVDARRQPVAEQARAVSDEVRALGELAQKGAPREKIDVELTRLRARYRAEPTLFDPATVAALRAIAQAPPPRPPLRADAPAAEAVLRDTFGYDSFRPGQREIIDAVLAGRDCIGVMPTGAGKSLTYQIPARILGRTALVVSPLIALMKDQVDAVNEVGIRATFLNSSLTADERRARVDALARGEYELVYAAPEGLEASVGALLARIQLGLVAVDEAHCISQWGHDFRPAYRNLRGLRRRFGDAPVLALTATATPAVTRDIVEQLAMRDPAEFRGSFFRPNLHIHAYKKGDERGEAVRDSILRLVHARRGESGIIYCLSRRSVDSLAEFLRKRGVRAAPYHAGMDPAARSKTQDDFKRDDIDVIVATVAFGMGIDKSNVRYVIHRDMPRSIEGYYQEIGRAGRDGAPSDCVLFFSWADVIGYDRFADESESEEIVAMHRALVRAMYRFAERPACRHRALAAHFGELIAPCGSSCDVCMASDMIAATPAVPARKRGRAATPGRARGATQQPDDDQTLYALESVPSTLLAHLKALRKRFATERGVPPYMVFSDATLLEMAARRPSTTLELRTIPGVGPKKLVQYGDAFLALLREHAGGSNVS